MTLVKLIHTKDGELKCSVNRNTPLEQIELDNEQELLLRWQRELNTWQRRRGNNHARRIILNYYKRLVKLNCTEVVPLSGGPNYFYATVRYPNGEERRWVGSYWDGWRTVSPRRVGRRAA